MPTPPTATDGFGSDAVDKQKDQQIIPPVGHEGYDAVYNWFKMLDLPF